MCQLSYICPPRSTFLHSGVCPKCWPVGHHRFPSSLASPCFQPCSESGGRQSSRSGSLLLWLPRKVTLDWLCLLTEGHCCWQASDTVGVALLLNSDNPSSPLLPPGYTGAIPHLLLWKYFLVNRLALNYLIVSVPSVFY